MDLSIVVPAFDEELRLGPTLHEIVEYGRGRGLVFEVVVVDDGSRDGTATLVRRIGQLAPEVRLIRAGHNHGKGYAVRTGVLNTTGDLVLFADADGATPIAELERLERAVRQGAEVAIGSRSLRGEGVTVTARWYRRAMGRTFHALVRLLTVRGITDTQCGFKLFRGPVAQELFSRAQMNGFSFDVELLMLAQGRGYQVAEVPVNWTHKPGSRIRLVRDSLLMARDIFRIRGNLARGAYAASHVAVTSDRPDAGGAGAHVRG